jgi:putative hydrolase of the HAD superfamily
VPTTDPVALFDLDDTLIDREAAFRRWAVWFCGERDLDGTAVEALCAADGFGYTPRDQMFATVHAQFDLRDPVGVLVEGYRSQYLSFFEEEPDVQAALTALRRAGWRIGVVTNGPAMQFEKVERAGLGPLVDAVCASEEAGSWKPDRGIFDEALRRLGTSADEAGAVWMTGDSAANDIGGARALGFSTVWVHRGRRWAEEAFSPDHTVDGVPAAVGVLLGAARP